MVVRRGEKKDVEKIVSDYLRAQEERKKKEDEKKKAEADAKKAADEATEGGRGGPKEGGGRQAAPLLYGLARPVRAIGRGRAEVAVRLAPPAGREGQALVREAVPPRATPSSASAGRSTRTRTGPSRTCSATGRSTANAENFSIRRARLILFGDVSDHLYLYFQPDFAEHPAGQHDRHLLRPAPRPVRRRVPRQGQGPPVPGRPVEGAVRLGEHAVEPEPRAARPDRRDQHGGDPERARPGRVLLLDAGGEAEAVQGPGGRRAEGVAATTASSASACTTARAGRSSSRT